MNGGIDPENHGTGRVHRVMHDWKENLEQKRMIRGLKFFLVVSFIVNMIQLALIILLILVR